MTVPRHDLIVSGRSELAEGDGPPLRPIGAPEVVKELLRLY